MVRAAACGAIDFTRSDPRDRHWWARTTLILDEIERRDRVESHRDFLARVVAGLARDDVDTKVRSAYLEAHQSLLDAIDRMRFPWRDTVEAPKVVDAAKAKADYEAAFGIDLASPEGQAAIDATVEFLRRQRAKARTHAR